MSTFSNNILTTAGKNLIAQATAANQIIYTKSIALETYIPPSSLVNFDSPDLLDGIEGVIVSASASGKVARVIAGFSNQSTAKFIKTAAVFGRLENEDTEHCIIASSDENASIRIPSESEASVQVQVSFNAGIEDDATVTVTSGNAASVGDLERLVSCHKAGNPSEGIAQDVYGLKTFKDGLNSLSQSNFTSIFANSVTFAYMAGPYITCDSIIPSVSNSGNIGSEDYKYKEVHATDYFGNLTGNVTGNLTGNVTGNVTSDLILPNTVNASSYGGDIGSVDKMFNNVISRGIYAYNLACTSITAWNGQGNDIANENYPFRGVYANHFHSVGSDASGFFGNLHGTIPYGWTVDGGTSDESLTIPVGAIVLLRESTGPDMEIRLGEDINCNTYSQKFKIGGMEGGYQGGLNDVWVGSGKFKALSYKASNQCLVLAIKVEL